MWDRQPSVVQPTCDEWLNFKHLVSISSTFCAQLFRQCQKIAKLNVIREKLLNLLSYEKRKRKMLLKLTPGYASPNFDILVNTIHKMV